MADYKIVGERIKELRIKNQKKQRDLCDAIHVEQVTISQYENGRRIPKLDILISIAQYFRVSLDYLVGITSIPNTASSIISDPPQENSLTNEELIMMEAFNQLTFDNQYIIIGKTKELIKEQKNDKQEKGTGNLKKVQ